MDTIFLFSLLNSLLSGLDAGGEAEVDLAGMDQRQVAHQRLGAGGDACVVGHLGNRLTGVVGERALRARGYGDHLGGGAADQRHGF